MDRIIGSFLEINGDIILQENESKLPGFIKRIRSKHYRKKLIKSINKLRNSKYILTKENIEEFFSYTYNGFPPYGKFKSVIMSKVDNDITEGVLKFDKYKIVISIYKNEENFEIHIVESNEYGNDSYNLYMDKLYSEAKANRELLYMINDKILNDICDFINDIIVLYK